MWPRLGEGVLRLVSTRVPPLFVEFPRAHRVRRGYRITHTGLFVVHFLTLRSGLWSSLTEISIPTTTIGLKFQRDSRTLYSTVAIINYCMKLRVGVISDPAPSRVLVRSKCHSLWYPGPRCQVRGPIEWFALNYSWLLSIYWPRPLGSCYFLCQYRPASASEIGGRKAMPSIIFGSSLRKGPGQEPTKNDLPHNAYGTTDCAYVPDV